MKKFLLFLFLPGVVFACGGTYTSDGDGYPVGPIFSTNDYIYLTGDLDRTNPPYEIFPIADIYIMRNYGFSGTNAFPLWDDEGAKNVVIGTYFPGSYIGELIAMPPLPEGEFDIIVDEDQDGIFNPGIDCIIEPGNDYGFKVIYLGELPDWLRLEVTRIKARAAEESLAMASAARTFSLGLFASSVAGVALSFWTDGVFIGCINAAAMVLGVPLSYDDAVVQIGQPIVEGLLRARQAHFASIALDPPDTSYMAVFPAPPVTFYAATIDHPVCQDHRKFAQLLSIQNSLFNALRISLERYQGALEEHEALSRRTQAKAIVKYARLLQRSMSLVYPVVESLKGYISSNGLDITISRSFIQGVKNRLLLSGFTPTELENFARYGISDSKRDSIRSAILSIDTAYVINGRFTDFLDSLCSIFEQTYTKIESLIFDAQELVDSTSSSFGVDNGNGSPNLEPYGVILGDSIMTLGSSITLTAFDTNSIFTANSFAWDTDLDGYFDDGVGTNVTFSPTEEGFHLVGVRLTNPLGFVDYAYKIIVVNIGNRAPVINSFSPDSVFVRLPVGGSVLFTASTADPDGDPITYRWYLDDLFVGGSSSFSYVPSLSDVGFHMLRLVVSDDNPYSNDAGLQWRLAVYNPVLVEEQLISPKDLALIAYPNPFNSSVKLAIYGATKENPILKIYDINGNEVFSTILAGNIFYWSPTYDIPSGLYFVRILFSSRILKTTLIYVK